MCAGEQNQPVKGSSPASEWATAIQSPDGFTLVELSIVLVIIGLITGGILVGRDLIHAAEIRSTVAQEEKLNVAAQTFRTKYNCLAGDCADAATFGFDVCPALSFGYSGNGNGVLDGREPFWF